MSLDLDDHRIEKMRTYVEGAVELDVRRRGRRARRVVGGGLAACLVVVIGGVGVQLLEPQGSSGDLRSSASSEASSDSDAAGSQGSADLQQSPSDSAPDASLRDDDVVTTGSITATVRDVDRTITELNTWLARHDGRVDGQSRSGSGDDASASLTLRVPKDQVDAAADELARLGRVDDVSIQRQDVGAERRDLDARIDALSISVDRLEQIMRSADNSSDLLAAEKSLSKRQADLESLQAQRRALRDSIDLSTIEVSLSTRASAQAPSDDGFTSGLVDGWNSLTTTVDGVVLATGFLLPWLALGAVVLGVVLLVRRRRG